MIRTDTSEIREKFAAIFAGNPEEHPLFQEMERDLTSGSRSKSSVLADLSEAAKFRAQNQRFSEGNPAALRTGTGIGKRTGPIAFLFALIRKRRRK